MTNYDNIIFDENATSEELAKRELARLTAAAANRARAGNPFANKRDPLKYLRHYIFERDSYTCVLCENGATDLHHVTPRSLGGENRAGNLVSLCRKCHNEYHNPPRTYQRFEVYCYFCDYLAMADMEQYLDTRHCYDRADLAPQEGAG